MGKIKRFLIILIGGNCLYFSGIAYTKDLISLSIGLAIIGWTIIITQQKK